MDKHKPSSSSGIIKKLIIKLEITKNKLLISLLTGFTVPFLFLVYSTFSVYFSNSTELGFGIGDFAPLFLTAAAVVFFAITITLLLTKKWLHRLVFALCAGLVICGYVQNMITTLTFRGLPGDGNTTAPTKAKIIINLLMWFAIFAVIIWFCVISSKAKIGKKVVSFLLLFVLCSQVFSFVFSAISFASKSAKEQPVEMYISNKNMYEVSENDNIFVFVLDRFDVENYKELTAAYPEVISELDGFTFYDDNISKYPRTYPAITYMLTGVENDFSSERSEYFENAYSTSTFLKDLKNNNYKINLYIPFYYTYTDADLLSDYVSNTSHLEGHSIANFGEFTRNMIKLSTYFWLPEKFKSQNISSNKFNESVVFEGDAPEYSITTSSDSKIYSNLMSSGLSTQKEQNTFTFLHLRGCHPPYTTDENCVYQEGKEIQSVQQTKGSFSILCEYIKQLKAMGLYEDATIIITGDHAGLTSDFNLYDSPKITTLLVKESGQAGTPLKTNSAPVSQDNLLATIIKSANIETSTDYGRACSEISEGEALTRVHYFQKSNGSGRKSTNITYEITGSAKDFSNWKITEEKENEH